MNQLHHRRRQMPCNCLRLAVRGFGLVTAFVVCGVGVDIKMHGFDAGVVIVDNYSKCSTCWSCLKIAGGWRLAPPYIAFGTGLVLWPHNLWLSYVAGVMMIILAMLRLGTVFRVRANEKDEGLLPQCSFEKVSTSPDVAEDGFVEIVPSLEDEDPLDDIC